MNEIKTVLAATVLALAAATAGATTATLQPGSKLWLEGDSTLHPYRSDAERIDLTAELERQKPSKLTVRIPIAALKSEHKGLDKNLQAALKAKDNPDIVFTLEKFEAAPGSDEVTAIGNLTVAGATKEETIRAKVAWKDGRAVVDGQEPLLMTDFGVKPPTMMMGTIKTSDRIVVKFHLVLGLDEGAPRGGK